MMTPGQDTGKRTGSRWWLPTLAAVDPPVNTAHNHGEASQCKYQVWCNIGTMHSIDPRYSIDKVAVVHAQGPLKDG